MNTPSATSPVSAPRRSASARPQDGLGQVAWVAALLLVGLATVFRAGNRHVPLLALEWLAIMVLVMLVWARYSLVAASSARHDEGLGRRLALGLVLTAPFWIAALQLLPSPVSGWVPSSLTPSDTALSMLAGLPVVACMAMALAASRQQLKTLLTLWMGIAVLQAAFGLVQLALPELRFEPNSGAPVLGTFGNRNGLANFLTMVLPLVVLALLSAPKRQGRRHKGVDSAARWGWSAALLLIVAGLLVTASRMGIGTGALVLVLAVVLFRPSRRAGDRGGAAQALLWTLPPALVLLALLAGGWDWLERFDADRLVSSDALRSLNRASTWQAAQQFMPWGSGLGSFGTVFPSFQQAEVGRWFVNFAHNDYLQFLMECGILVVPPFLAVLWLVGKRLQGLWAARSWSDGPGGWVPADALAVACGLAVMAQALHAWMDYPWRIPANAMLGAFMLGVFLRSPGLPEHRAG